MLSPTNMLCLAQGDHSGWLTEANQSSSQTRTSGDGNHAAKRASRRYTSLPSRAERPSCVPSVSPLPSNSFSGEIWRYLCDVACPASASPRRSWHKRCISHLAKSSPERRRKRGVHASSTSTSWYRLLRGRACRKGTCKYVIHPRRDLGVFLASVDDKIGFA